MRAISIQQPWAFAVCHLGKRIENRERWAGCYFRGPLLIHASKGVGTRSEFDDAVGTILEICKPSSEEGFAAPFAHPRTGRGSHVWEPSPHLKRGGIVGYAWLDGTIANEEHWKNFAAENPDHAEQRRWWFGGFALVLRDVQPIDFIPWKGSLGLFDVPCEPVFSTGTRFQGLSWERGVHP